MGRSSVVSRKRRAEGRARAGRPRRAYVAGGAILAVGATLFASGVLVHRHGRVQATPVPPFLAEVDGRLAERVLTLTHEAASRPRQADAHGRLGILYEAHGFLGHAISCYANAVSAAPKEPRWWYHWASAVERAGDREGAERAYREVVRLKPDYAPAHERMGWLLADQNRHIEALAAFQRVVELAPQEPQGYVGVGSLDVAMELWQPAVVQLGKALERDPGNALAHYLLGRACRALGRAARAEIELSLRRGAERVLLPDACGAAVTLGCVTLTGRAELAVELSARGQATEATAILESLHHEQPDNAPVANNLALAYLKAGRLEDADRMLRRALERCGEHFALRLTYAQLMLQRQELPLALAHAEHAVRLSPEQGGAHATQAEILRRMGRAGEALDSFRRAAALELRRAAIQLSLGGLLAAMEQWDEAEAAFERAVAAAPESIAARQALGRLYARRGRFEQAAVMLRGALMVDPGNPRIEAALRRLPLGVGGS